MASVGPRLGGLLASSAGLCSSLLLLLPAAAKELRKHGVEVGCKPLYEGPRGMAAFAVASICVVSLPLHMASSAGRPGQRTVENDRPWRP